MPRTASPLVLPAGDIEVDCLAEYTPIPTAATDLREGMVLLDDLDTPTAIIDHRIKATPRAGGRRFMLLDLETGKYTDATFTNPVNVAGR